MVGTVLFTVVVTVVAVAGVLVVVGVGLPLLLAAAALVRGAAHLERQRAAMVPGIVVVEPPADPTGAITRPSQRRATTSRRRGRACSPPCAGSGPIQPWPRRSATWSRLYPPLLLLDAVAAGLWLGILGGVTIPLWYWAVPQTFEGVTHHGLFWGSFPHGPGGPDAVGLAIDDLPTALAVAGRASPFCSWSSPAPWSWPPPACTPASPAGCSAVRSTRWPRPEPSCARRAR